MPQKKKEKVGLLGVPSSSKLRVTIQSEIWSKVDESDSDYTPDGARRPRRSPRIQERSPSKRNKKRQSLDDGDNSRREDGGNGTGESVQNLPLEIIIKIFQHVVGQGGAIPILYRLSRVCKSFYLASKEPCLWQHVDLSFGWIKSTILTLKWLATNNRFKHVKEINLSNWIDLRSTGIKIITDACPTLQAITLSKCRRLMAHDVMQIVDKCTELSRLDISYMCRPVSAKVINYALEKCGDNLTDLNFSGNQIQGMSCIMKSLSDCCPNLKVLDISNCHFSSFSLHIEQFQAGCPNLKVLRITNSVVSIMASSVTSQKMAMSKGFPCLEEVSLAVDPYGGGQGSAVTMLCTDASRSINMNVNFYFLYRLLKNSPRLILLDLRGCNNISPVHLEELPATDLECLYLSYGSGTTNSVTELENVLIKWRHSLVDLDLSWNLFSAGALDKALRAMAENHQPVLAHVNLSGTTVTADGIRYLLEGCKNLKSLDLTSCRSLPRGCKRKHDAPSIDMLRTSLNNQ